MSYPNWRLIEDSRELASIAPNAYQIDDIFIENIECEIGNYYTLGYTFDGSEYQVLLIEPEEIIGRYRVIDCHLWSSGKLCISELPDTGWHDLKGARARGVLWCTAFSLYEASGEFHFNP